MAPRSVEDRIAWFLANDPSGVGMCAQHSWRSLGGDYGDPPAWGADNANEVYDLVVASGRYWTTEPPRGAVVLWKYGVNGHMEIGAGGGQVVTTDPPGNPGGTGYQPSDHVLSWGGVLSRRIWTDEYNGVRFDVAGYSETLPPMPASVGPAASFDSFMSWSFDQDSYDSDGYTCFDSDQGGHPIKGLPAFSYLVPGLAPTGTALQLSLFTASTDPLPQATANRIDFVANPSTDGAVCLYNGSAGYFVAKWAGPSTLQFLTAPAVVAFEATGVTLPVQVSWSFDVATGDSVVVVNGSSYSFNSALSWSEDQEWILTVEPDTVVDNIQVGVTVPAPSFDFTGPTGDYDLGSLPGYSTRVTPLPDANIPGIPEGSEYQIELLDPDGNVVAIGYLPRGADPNGPFTFRVNGRFIVILYGGKVLITYLIPQAIWDSLELSSFWVGYIDPVTGLQLPDGDGVRGTPPPEGYQYELDTAFEEIVYPTRLSRVKNLYSEAIWEDGNGIQASRLPLDGVYQAAQWGLNNGHKARISYGLAVRVWEAGLSRFLKALPNEVDREPLTWGASMDAWSTSDYDWLGNGLTTIKS